VELHETISPLSSKHPPSQAVPSTVKQCQAPSCLGIAGEGRSVDGEHSPQGENNKGKGVLDLKQFKKIIALAMALVMVLCMSAVALADGTNNLVVDGSLVIGGLDAGDTVKLYRVIDWDNGATNGTGNGWVVNSRFTGEGKLSAEEVSTIIGTATTPGAISSTVALKIKGIAAGITGDGDYQGTAAAITEPSCTGIKITTPTAGLYVAIVTPVKPGTVYNPIFVAADYQQPTTGNTNEWQVVNLVKSYSNAALAKKEQVTVTKELTDSDTADASNKLATNVDVGEVLKFTVTTIIPYFDATDWTDPSYKFTDTLTGLKLVVDTDHPITVKTCDVGGTLAPLTAGDSTYTTNGAKTDDISLVIDFAKAYLLSTTVTEAQDLEVTYYAKISDTAAKNVNPTDNSVVIEYTNNPADESSKGKLKDRTNQYSFSLDADVFGQEDYESSEIIKIGVDKNGSILTTTQTYNNGTTTSPLQGASFALLTTNNTDKIDALIGKTEAELKALGADSGIYRNDQNPSGAAFTSTASGKMNIKGLDAGTYYLVETKAPDGYIRDTNVYTITINASYKDETVNETLPGNIPVTYTTKILDYYTVAISDGTNTQNSRYDMTYGTEGVAKVTLATSSKHTATNTIADNSTLISNTQGVELPSTGGIGTTIFYVVGAVLMLGAAAIMVARRKAEQE